MTKQILTLILALLLCFLVIHPVVALDARWNTNISGNHLSSVSITSDGKRIVSGSTDGDICLFSDTGEVLWKISEPGTQIAKISSDGSAIVAGSQEELYADKGVLRYFYPDGSLRSKTITGWISDLHIAKNGTNSVLGTIRGVIELIGPDGEMTKFSSADVLQTVPIGDVAISPDGSTIAYSTWGGKEPRFVITGKRYYRNIITRDTITGIALSSNGSYLAETVGEGTLGKLSLRYGNGTVVWSNKTHLIHNLLIADDASVVVSGTDDGVIHAYSHSGNQIWEYQADGPIIALSMTPSASKIVAGTSNGTIYLLDKNGSLLGKYHDNGLLYDGVSLLEISRNGGSFITVLNGKEMMYFKTEDNSTLISGVSKPTNSDPKIVHKGVGYLLPDFSYIVWFKQMMSESSNNFSLISNSDKDINYWSAMGSSSSVYTLWIYSGQKNIRDDGASGKVTNFNRTPEPTYEVATPISPLVGDWDGNGMSKIGTYNNGSFYLDMNGNGLWNPGIDKVLAWNGSKGSPLVGDWDGNRKSKIGIYNN